MLPVDTKRIRVYHENDPVELKDFIIDNDDFTRSFQIILTPRKADCRNMSLSLIL